MMDPLYATVIGPLPASVDDPVWIITPLFDGGQHKTPCRWAGGDPPTVGEACVVVWTDEQPWAVGLTPPVGGGGGPPTGAAGGVLGGSYPNPSFAADMATQAELDAEAAARASADSGKADTTDTRFPVAGEKSALAGTSGTPGSGNKYVTDGDSRNTNARTPSAHASTHQPGGSDAMAVDAAAATGSLRTLGTGAAQATAGNDSRLTDARTPTAHATSHQPGGSDAMAVDAAAATGSLRTLGTGAAQAAPGNDARFIAPREMFDIPIFGVPTAQTNWSTYAVSATQFFNSLMQSSGAQNAEITFPFTCRAGTYSIAALWMGANSFGIITFSVDGSSVGTLDEYQVTPTAVRSAPITGLAITAGDHALNLKMATKNASSSSYTGRLSGLIFTRTGP